MKAILHIGTEKTGTTTTQNFLHEHCDALLDQNVLYPRQMGGVGQRNVASYGLTLGTADEYIQALGLTSEQQIAEFHQQTKAKLAEQVNANPSAAYCVISSEHLHSRLRSTEQIAKVQEMLSDLFTSVEVHIHLRPQVDVAVSLASTQSRVGGRVGRGFFQSVRADKMYYNYDMLVTAWEEIFGSQNVRCLAFNESPDYLQWLTKRISLDLSTFPRQQRINEALDVEVMALVNALVDSGTPQRVDFKVLDRLPVRNRLSLSQDMARQIQHRFEESNRSLILRRHDLSPGQLEPNWRKYPQQGNFHLLEAECHFSGALAGVVQHYSELLAKQ